MRKRRWFFLMLFVVIASGVMYGRLYFTQNDRTELCSVAEEFSVVDSKEVNEHLLSVQTPFIKFHIF